jgi:deoxyribonuclease-4
MALLGAHCGTVGGLANCWPEARDLGCEAVQIFVKSNRMWAMGRLDPADAEAFAAGARKLPGGPAAVLAHAAYLVNLASVDPLVAERSRKGLAAEIRRCHELGIPQLVLHPGSHGGAGEEPGERLVGEALRAVLEDTADCRVRVLLEIAAGQGSALGTTPEGLGRMIGHAGGSPRLGVCLDTCHAFASGHDLRAKGGMERLLDATVAAVGLERIGAIHLNDSKGELGCRKDRHESLGLGTMGDEAFRALVNDPRLATVPMILETPGDLEGYRADLERLRGFRKG